MTDLYVTLVNLSSFNVCHTMSTGRPHQESFFVNIKMLFGTLLTL